MLIQKSDEHVWCDICRDTAFSIGDGRREVTKSGISSIDQAPSGHHARPTVPSVRLYALTVPMTESAAYRGMTYRGTIISSYSLRKRI